MAVAQRGTGVGQSYAAVGLGYNLVEQIALREGLVAAIDGAGAIGEIPEGIVAEPVLVEFLVGEDVVERELVAQLGTLYIACQLEESVCQFVSFSLVEPVGVAEEQTQHVAVVTVATLEAVEQLLGATRHLLLVEHLVVLVHVVHVVVAGVVGDVELGVDAHQLLQRVLHRQDAAYHHGALGVYIGLALKHLGKPLPHPSGYLAVLLGSALGELAVAVHGFLSYACHLVEHLTSLGGKLAQTVGAHEGKIGTVVVGSTYKVTRAVASIMTQIERLVSLGRGGKPALRTGVSQIATGRYAGVLLDFLTRVLRLCTHCQRQQRYDN